MIILEGDKALYDQLYKRYEDRLLKIDKSETNESKQFYAAELRLQWSFVALKFDHQWKAFWTLRKATQLIDDHSKQYPNYEPSKSTKGLSQVVLSLVPDDKKWLTNLFGIDGDFQEGYKLLSETAQLDGQWDTESQLLMALIDTYLLEERSSLHDIPSAPLFAYVKGLVFLKQNQAAFALKQFEQLPQSLAIRNYLLGKAHLLLGDYEKVLANKSHPYVQSVAIKAKIELNRLSE